MPPEGMCKFYRPSQRLSMGQGIGYCDLDCLTAICEGDTRFCEKPGQIGRPTGKEKEKHGKEGSIDHGQTRPVHTRSVLTLFRCHDKERHGNFFISGSSSVENNVKSMG